MPSNFCFTCGRETPDDDPEDECRPCRDQREAQEQRVEDEATAACDGPCRVCAPMDQASCHIKAERERRSAEQWWREGR